MSRSVILLAVAASLAGFSGSSIFQALWSLLKGKPIPSEKWDILSYFFFVIAVILAYVA